ncbi:MAG TPA: class I SAM-dependent methyltransferase [Blastocatellia bacterium]|nr:class I SAM-dependent methyltransferase [Blastocatellia bacterium]
MKTWKALTIALSVALIGAQAQQRRDPQEYIKLLESERRVENLQVDRVVDTLEIKPGQRVADIGAGSGLFTRPIAKKAGETGTVYAIDIDPDLLKHIEKTARDEKLSNVRTIMAAEDDPRIPDPVDLIVLVDTLHHIKGQGAYLKSLRRYMRPEGRIAVIDFSESWPAGHEQMKYTLADLEKWMKEAGFKQVEKHDFLNNNFFVVYQ